MILSQCIISGNKTDREDKEIPTSVGEDFANRHDMYFVETSAKEAENVERLFMVIASELMEVILNVFSLIECLILIFRSKHGQKTCRGTRRHPSTVDRQLSETEGVVDVSPSERWLKSFELIWRTTKKLIEWADRFVECGQGWLLIAGYWRLFLKMGFLHSEQKLIMYLIWQVFNAPN